MSDHAKQVHRNRKSVSAMSSDPGGAMQRRSGSLRSLVRREEYSSTWNQDVNQDVIVTVAFGATI